MVATPGPSAWSACRRLLADRLRERAPARIQLLAGPRQVGKTTLLLDLARETGDRAVYAALDAPEAGLPGFWEQLWERAARVARPSAPAVLLLDEVQHLVGWAARLKASWDHVRRTGRPIHVVASGSSALRLGAGSRESLAGRFERHVLGHWTAADLVAAFRVSRREAVRLVVTQGTYPGAMAYRRDRVRWAAYVRDAIIEPAVGRDVLALEAVRRPALLRQLFALAVGNPARIVALAKLQAGLAERGALETIAHYLGLLADAFLVAPLEKHSQQVIRRRAAPPKLVVLNNAFLGALDPAGPPDHERDQARFGSWVENACLAHAWSCGQQVRYWREEPLEVDAVLDGSWGRWAIEVKTGSVTAGDLRGLLEFTRRFPGWRPLLLCDRARVRGAATPGVDAMGWEDFLLAGPPARAS